MLELKAWIPVTQQWKEFTPEIVDAFASFVEENKLDLTTALQDAVSKIMWHNNHYLRNFDLWETRREVEYVLTSDQDGIIIDLDSDGQIELK